MAPSREDWLKNVRKQRLKVQVKTIRRSKSMSVSELAEKSGYDEASIKKIENGTFLPDKDKKKDIDIANALGVSLDQLWGRKRFDTYSSGQPKLTEPEKTAITLLAPMYKALSEEGREHLINTSLLLLKAEGKTPSWEEYVPKREISDASKK